MRIALAAAALVAAATNGLGYGVAPAFEIGQPPVEKVRVGAAYAAPLRDVPPRPSAVPMPVVKLPGDIVLWDDPVSA